MLWWLFRNFIRKTKWKQGVCSAYFYSGSSFQGKPVGRSLELSGRCGETSVPDCCFETDLWLEIHPIIRISRMQNHFIQEDYVPFFSSEQCSLFLVPFMWYDKGVLMTMCTTTGGTPINMRWEWHWWHQLVGLRFLQAVLEFSCALCFPV